ncbi:hypothetical protein QK911_12905 [Lactococcus lactis]
MEEQKYAFEQILSLAKQNQVDGIIIAGDLYDRAVPVQNQSYIQSDAERDEYYRVSYLYDFRES